MTQITVKTYAWNNLAPEYKAMTTRAEFFTHLQAYFDPHNIGHIAWHSVTIDQIWQAVAAFFEHK